MIPDIKKSDIVTRKHFSFKVTDIKGKNAEKTMERGCKILEELGYHYWITSGNLLGIYRDKKLIDHDTDIDICVLVDIYWDVYKQVKKLTRKMARVSMPCVYTTVVKNRPMQMVFMDQNNHEVLFDIYFYHEYPGYDFGINWSAEGIIKKPLKFIKKLGKIKFKGVTYPTPKPLEKFLEWRFGKDWKTPKKKKDDWVKDANHLTLWEDL